MAVDKHPGGKLDIGKLSPANDIDYWSDMLLKFVTKDFKGVAIAADALGRAYKLFVFGQFETFGQAPVLKGVDPVEQP